MARGVKRPSHWTFLRTARLPAYFRQLRIDWFNNGVLVKWIGDTIKWLSRKWAAYFHHQNSARDERCMAGRAYHHHTMMRWSDGRLPFPQLCEYVCYCEMHDIFDGGKADRWGVRGLVCPIPVILWSLVIKEYLYRCTKFDSKMQLFARPRLVSMYNQLKWQWGALEWIINSEALFAPSQ